MMTIVRLSYLLINGTTAYRRQLSTYVMLFIIKNNVALVLGVFVLNDKKNLVPDSYYRQVKFFPQKSNYFLIKKYLVFRVKRNSNK